MQVPTYGSSAYQYDSYYQERPKKKVVRKVRVVKKKKAKASHLASALLFGMAAMMAFCLLFRYAQILEKTDTVKRMQKELATIEAQAVAKEFEIERNLDLETIETEAITRLGMQRPTKAQTVYIDMCNCDLAEPAKGTTVEGANLFSSVIDTVKAYF